MPVRLVWNGCSLWRIVCARVVVLRRELARVLRPGSGRALLVTGARTLMREALRQVAGGDGALRVLWQRDLVIGGRSVLLVSLRRQ